jgi:hypothetical protein
MRLREETRRWGATWTTRGAAVVAVLEAIPVATSLGERILAAGTAGGWWTQAGSRGVSIRSGSGERTPLTDPGPRAPPPTTSPVSEAATSDVIPRSDNQDDSADHTHLRSPVTAVRIAQLRSG